MLYSSICMEILYRAQSYKPGILLSIFKFPHFVILVLFREKTSFSPSFVRVLLMIKVFLLYKYVLISLSVIKDIFTECRIFDWKDFSFSILNNCATSFWPALFLLEIFCHSNFSLWIKCHFFPLTFKSFCLYFQKFNSGVS